MSLPPSSPQVEEDKVSLLSADAQDVTGQNVRNDSIVSKIEAPSNGEQRNNGFLRTPLVRPIRSLSPDTISNLSADEYEQIRPVRAESQANAGVRVPSQSPSPLRGWRAKLRAFYIRNLGLAYMLAAQIFGTLMNVTTRLLEIEGNRGKGLHPLQILFARMGITLVLASGYMFYKKTPHFPLGMPEVRWLLLARGFGGFFGVFGMYYSLLYLPLADATVLTFLAPGLACWVCSYLIKEPFTRMEKIGTFVSMLGVVFIARPTSLFSGHSATPPASGDGDVALPVNGTADGSAPDFANYDNVTPTQRLAAVGIAMVGVLGAVTAFTTIRWIGKRAHPLISVNYFAAWSTLVSITLQFALPGVGFLLPSDLKEWGYLLFLGTCGFIMQFLLAAGLSYEKSSRATNMTYTQMLFALTFDKLIFDHTPGWMSIIGSSLILGSAIFVAMQKDVGQSKEQTEGTTIAGDEESQRGLISGMDVETGEDHDRTVNGQRMPVQEVQMRTLR